MTDFQADSRVVMAARLIADVMKAQGDGPKSDLLAGMRTAGVERVRVVDADGTNLGAVTLCASATKAKVSDDRAFLAWVRRNHPTEIVEVVRPSFRDAILAYATAQGMPVDREDTVIPGVEMVPGAPFLSCRPTRDALERMRETLTASGVLAIAAGPAESTVDGDV